MHVCMYRNHSSIHRDEHVSRRGEAPVAFRHVVPPYTSPQASAGSDAEMGPEALRKMGVPSTGLDG